MREPKYKAWILGKMWDVRGLDWTEDGIIIHTDGGFMHLCEEDDVALREYIGLKDKNSVEIYEGDIVRDIDSKDKGEVIWDEDAPCFTVKFLNELWGFVSHHGKDNHCEVIGNIYESPGLLQ